MISAIVLAAGSSRRMKQSKMVLPWSNTTVIGKVIGTLIEAGVNDLHVVAGGNQKELENALTEYQINFIFNPEFGDGEMLTSIQAGLKGLPEESEAVLLVLGDQPQIEVSIVHVLLQSYISSRNQIIIPSYRMHRGHPVIIEKSLHNAILDLHPPDTLRDFLHRNQHLILHVNVNSSSILQDLDTPREYKQYKP